MRKTIKFFFTRVYTITSIVLFALSYGAIQAYAVYYPTDNITNPTCAPGDSGCYVSLLPSQTSNAGKLLVTDGTNPSWGTSIESDLTIKGITAGTGSFNVVSNTVFGKNAMGLVTIGNNNTAFGFNASYSLTEGYWNTAVSVNALYSNTTGYHNTAVGVNALYSNTTGASNSAFGAGALRYNVSGINNTSIGSYSLHNSIGSDNSSFGYYSGLNITSGSDNSFFGYNTGLGITTGSNNTIIGANVSGLSSSLSNNIIIADGQGNQRINVNSIGDTEIGGNIYSAGLKWQTTAPIADRQWVDLVYGNGLFVAVAQGPGSGTDRIMTSVDGVNWTQRTHPISALKSVTYANGLFVASGFTNGRIITSRDGINWTLSSSASGQIYDVAYGNGLFVGVKIDSSLNRVTTSPDSITWTNRTTDVSMDKAWVGVTYGNGLFVAVAESAGTQSVMTSPDGMTWTLQTHPSLSGGLENVAYGDGKFVAVGVSGNVMTSTDGINWTLQTFPNTALLYRITYADGLFVTAGAFSTTNNNIYTSPDGITWTTRVVPKNDWAGVAYGNGRFVMVAYSGTLGSRVAYSGKMSRLDTLTANIFHGNHFFTGNVGVGNTSSTYSLNVGSSTVVGIVSRFQNSTGTCDINPTTTSLSCSSDINLKKNITTLKDNQPFVLNTQTPDTSVLKNLNKITPVIYNWTTEQDIDTKHPGFIAQDVEQIFPSLVSTDPTTNLKSLNYIGLIPYAIEGIKELDIKLNQQASLDTEITGSFGYLAKEFLNTVNTYIKDLTVGKIKVDGDVCVDDVCISKEQFKQMLIDQQNKTGQVNNVVQENNPEIIPDNQNNEEEPIPDNQEIPVPPIE